VRAGDDQHDLRRIGSADHRHIGKERLVLRPAQRVRIRGDRAPCHLSNANMRS